MSITAEQFLDECRRQHVIVAAEAYGNKTPAWRREKRSLFNAVTFAGYQRLCFPGNQLSNKPVQITDDLHEDVAAATFGSIINSSHKPASGKPHRRFRSQGYQELAGCPAAESRFAYTFEQLGKRDLKAAACIIYIDGETPVFLKKTYYEESALALADITIDGTDYPAGALCDVRFRGIDHNTRYRTPQGESWVHPVRHIGSAAFVRLTEYALPPEQRDIDAFSSTRYSYKYMNSGQMEIFSTRTIGDIAGQVGFIAAHANMLPDMRNFS